jgi:putative NIF3 family GTP cyclohydrolase 1 type 2
MLLGVDADVYFTGEMSHVGLDHEVLRSNLFIYAQHEVLAALASGRNVILCKSSDRPLRNEFLTVLLGGHTNTERGYLPVLASKLRTELAKLDGEEKRFEAASVHISQEDRHPLDFV